LIKYGYSVFKLEILEYCEPKNVIKREQYYLNLLEPKYNILQTAGSSFGYKHTEETKSKISIALKGENNPMFGRKGEKNPMFGKSNPRAYGSGSPPIPIKVFDNETKLTTTYESISEAARILGIKKSIISRFIQNNQKNPYKSRFVFKKL
jgi:group I intron endonuclease